MLSILVIVFRLYFEFFSGLFIGIALFFARNEKRKKMATQKNEFFFLDLKDFFNAFRMEPNYRLFSLSSSLDYSCSIFFFQVWAEIGSLVIFAHFPGVGHVCISFDSKAWRFFFVKVFTFFFKQRKKIVCCLLLFSFFLVCSTLAPLYLIVILF